jgi:hypothetical protein
MHAVQLLHKMIKKSCVGIHANRLNALFIAVDGLIIVGKLSLAGLGRSLITKTKVKYNIKRIDRLLGNSKLQNERVAIYDNVTKLIIANTKRPPIIVDWSSLPNKKFHLLRAAVPTVGRSLTIYEEVHPVKKLSNAKVHKAFLNSLSNILPKDCKPIIITDAGFLSPFFREVWKLQWDWVGRIRNFTKYKTKDDWVSCSFLHKKANRTPTFICKTTLSKSTPIECYLFLYKGKKKGRIDKTQSGKRAKGKYSRTVAKAKKEPWVLATSLSGGDRIAKKVILLYKRRMQIEEGFRDVKNSRLGFSLEESKTYTLKRFEILLLIAMLAILAVSLLGKIGTQRGIQYDYQANTIRHRTVLSLFFLGCQMTRQGNIDFKKEDFLKALSLLRGAIVQTCQGVEL